MLAILILSSSFSSSSSSVAKEKLSTSYFFYYRIHTDLLIFPKNSEIWIFQKRELPKNGYHGGENHRKNWAKKLKFGRDVVLISYHAKFRANRINGFGTRRHWIGFTLTAHNSAPNRAKENVKTWAWSSHTPLSNIINFIIIPLLVYDRGRLPKFHVTVLLYILLTWSLMPKSTWNESSYEADFLCGCSPYLWLIPCQISLRSHQRFWC